MRTISLGLLALSLSACVSILPEGADLPPRLALDPGPEAAAPGAPLGVTLSVDDPASEKVFNTSGVAVQTSPLQYEYLAGAEWTDRVPLLLGSFLERSFENTGRLAATGDPVTLPVSDYTLQTDIRAFNVDRTGEDRAVVAYGATLNAGGRALGTRVFRAEVPLQGRGNDATVRALNEAVRRTADDVVAWSFGLIEADGAGA
jgi:cholesterol transport system auxiliary component